MLLPSKPASSIENIPRPAASHVVPTLSPSCPLPQTVHSGVFGCPNLEKIEMRDKKVTVLDSE